MLKVATSDPEEMVGRHSLVLHSGIFGLDSLGVRSGASTSMFVGGSEMGACDELSKAAGAGRRPVTKKTRMASGI